MKPLRTSSPKSVQSGCALICPSWFCARLGSFTVSRGLGWDLLSHTGTSHGASLWRSALGLAPDHLNAGRVNSTPCSQLRDSRFLGELDCSASCSTPKQRKRTRRSLRSTSGAGVSSGPMICCASVCLCINTISTALLAQSRRSSSCDNYGSARRQRDHCFETVGG